MPRTHANEEVQILRFFEEAPLERAELLFNIVKEKMRDRGVRGPNPDGVSRKRRKDATEHDTSPISTESPR